MDVGSFGQAGAGVSDRNQNWFIHEWLMDHTSAREWTVLHARLRDDPGLRSQSSARTLAVVR